jgi:hypothetical protein
MAQQKYIRQSTDEFKNVKIEEFVEFIKSLRPEKRVNGIYYYDGYVCKAIFKHSPKIEYLITK